MCWVMCQSTRGEDLLNQEIKKSIPYNVKGTPNFISLHVKAYALVQAHISRLDLPSLDYITDQITELDSQLSVSPRPWLM